MSMYLSSFIKENLPIGFIRRHIYPLINGLLEIYLKRSLSICDDLLVQHVFWGQRGNDQETHRRLLNSIATIEDKTVLIFGCGKGQEIQTWLSYKPAKIVACDPIEHPTEWEHITRLIETSSYPTKVEFLKASIDELDSLDLQFDIIASEAVFEHLNSFQESIAILISKLTHNGFLYSTWGPLWTSFGGDHICGGKKLEDGYTHLLLSDKDYKDFLSMNTHHTEYIWHEKGFFSYLRPSEYLPALMRTPFPVSIVYSSALIDPRASRFIKQFPDKAKIILREYLLSDILTSGMTIILQAQNGEP